MARRDPFDDTTSPPAAQIRQAATPAQRARILLQLPDAIVAAIHLELRAACEATDFDVGLRFLQARTNALSATRDICGVLPERVLAPLELWRGVMIGCTRMTS